MLFHIIHWECILMSKLIHFKCDKFVEVEGDKISLTKTTPPEASSRKSLEDKITDLFKG